MFFLAIMSFFVFAISGVQLVSGGYLIAGVPALVISGIVPVLSSLWTKKINSEDYKKMKHKFHICDCLDLGKCCDCD